MIMFGLFVVAIILFKMKLKQHRRASEARDRAEELRKMEESFAGRFNNSMPMNILDRGAIQVRQAQIPIDMVDGLWPLPGMTGRRQPAPRADVEEIPTREE